MISNLRKMSGLKFSGNLTMLFVKESAELLGRYPLAAKAGFKAVETPFPYEATPEDLAQVLESLGLEQVLINTDPGPDCLGYAALVGKEDLFMASLNKSIQYCKATKCKLLHIMAGVASGDLAACPQVYTANLRVAADVLAKEGIIGVIEPLSIKPGYFLNSFQQAEEVIHEVNSPNIRLLMDFYHMQRLCGNLTNNIKKLLPITGHIQIAQVPERDEPLNPGEINYGFVFQLLEDQGYTGYVGLEYTPKAATLDGLMGTKFVN